MAPERRVRREPVDTHPFRTLLRLRLGLPQSQFATAQLCRACLELASDCHGHHALSCMHGGAKTDTHSKVVLALYALCNQALLSPQREAHCFHQDPHKRIDILLRLGFRKSQLIDFACTSPLRPDAIANAARCPGGAATAYESKKVAIYGALVDATHQQLVPCIVDSLGAWSDSADSFLRSLGRFLAQRADSPPYVAAAKVFATLNITLMRSIAQTILQRVDCPQVAVMG